MLHWLSMLAGTKLKKLQKKCGCLLVISQRSISQKEASFDFDQKVHAALVANADIRGQQRLKRSAQPHSCGFITAVPSDEVAKIV